MKSPYAQALQEYESFILFTLNITTFLGITVQQSHPVAYVSQDKWQNYAAHTGQS